MSLGSILSLARTAILANQSAIEVTGHNIANAETEGYTRQELQLVPGPPLQTPQGNFGLGVNVRTVSRARDALLDQNLRTQLAPSAGYAARSDVLGSLQQVFGEPSDTGIASALDAFWNSWSDLASNPASAGAKSVVQQRAIALTSRISTAAGQIDTLTANVRAQVVDTVTQVNRLSHQIGELNLQIVPAESGGHTANDLRDQRDKLIDQLSSLVPVSVIDRNDGSDQIMLGGRPLVDGSVSHDLTLLPGTTISVAFAGESEAVNAGSGKLGALMQVANVDIGHARTALDTLASALITDVNALHITGWSPPSGAGGNWDPLAGPTGSNIPFFDTAPANANALNIRLSAQVAANADAISVGDALDAPGNNKVALQLAALRDFSPTAPGNSFSGAYGVLVSQVATTTRAASDSQQVASTLVSQAADRRDAVSGVNTDEELMRIMRYQQAYAAAAKVVSAVDDMAQTLLDMKR
ncbi:MAG TPA: flagellar hook-associated protein FlgK [Gemmatimonadaceae bacterium]|nr:flagellar hook-associated protein FlgK [Gemmatimonadaceae bacterium]